MFTIEMEFDDTCITLMDDTGHHDDVIFDIFDDIVYIRQWVETLDKFSVITMSPDMFDAFRSAMNLPEGTYILRKPNED